MTGAIGLALLLAAAAPAAEPSPREAMREGRQALQAGDLPAAAAAFDRAAEGAPDAKLDPARARFNQGLALQQQDGKDAEAEAALDQALRTTDVRLQARALYNRGHLLTGRAKALAEQNRWDPAEKDAEKAVESFQDALILDSSDERSRVGFEIVQPMLQEIRKKKQEMQQQQVNRPDPEGEKKLQPDPEGPEKMLQPDKNGDSKAEQPEKPSGEPPNGQPQDQTQAGEMGEPESAGGTGEEKPEDMSKEEAMMLLDAMKAEEAAMREKLRLRLGRPVPVDKDW